MTPDELGGPGVHSQSGVTDFVVEDEMAALEAAQPDAINDGGAGAQAASDANDAYNIERDNQGNVVRLVRG